MQPLNDIDDLIYERARETIEGGEHYRPLLIAFLAPRAGYPPVIAHDIADVLHDNECLEAAVSMMLTLRGALAVVTIAQAWQLTLTYKALAAFRASGRHPSEHPNGTEMLIVHYHFKNGKQAIAFHRIHRGSEREPPWLERGELILEPDIRPFDVEPIPHVLH